MWKCKRCKHKNNNSSEKCHGHNCKAMREKEAYEIPIKLIPKEKKVKKLYDYCQACKKDMFFTETRWRGKKAWSCESGSHRPCNFSGKSKPFPVQIIPEEAKIIDEIR